MAWNATDNAANKLKEELSDFIRSKFDEEDYKDQLPKRHIYVGHPNSTKKVAGSIKVLLYTGADEEPPHTWIDNNNRVVEEWHLVTIDVSSDERGAFANEDVTVADILRQIFTSSSAKLALINLGIYNVRESMDAVEMDDVEFNRTVNFRCSTDRNIAEV